MSSYWSYDLIEPWTQITFLQEAVRPIYQDLIDRLSYVPFPDPPNIALRKEVTADITSWNAGLSPEFIDGLMDTGCTIAQYSYRHTSYAHQYFIAIYTACVTYVDDLVKHNLEAVGQFVQRFARGEPQDNPALARLVTLLETAHEYWPRISANSIVVGTTDAITAMYVEYISKGDVSPAAAMKYPIYLRLKTGITTPYAHFNFSKSEDGALEDTHHLQLMP